MCLCAVLRRASCGVAKDQPQERKLLLLLLSVGIRSRNLRVGGTQILRGAWLAWVRTRGDRSRGRGQAGVAGVGTHNTNDGAVVGDIICGHLLDEASREEKAKEADDAEAEGPAS